MINRRKIKLLVSLGLLCIFLFVIGMLAYRDHQRCMGVRLVEEDVLSGYTEDLSLDISSLLFDGEKAAIDFANNTVYISQPEDKLLHGSALVGTLTSSDPNYSLYFLKDSVMRNIAETVSTSTPVTLIVVKENSFRTVNVIITTLPVLRMEGAVSGINESGRDVYSGNLSLWTPNDPGAAHYTVKSSDAQWHVRGQASSYFPKKSWKITLKTESGDNRNLNMLGLDNMK